MMSSNWMMRFSQMLALLVAWAGSTGGAVAFEVWIANQAGETGTQVLDPELNLLATIPGSDEHTHMGDFTSNFKTYYSANVGEPDAMYATVDIIDADLKQIIGTVETAGRSHAVVVSEDDRFAYINNLNDNTEVIDTATGTIVHRIDIGDGPGGEIDRPVCIGMSANSKKLFHASAANDQLIILTVDNLTATQTAAQIRIPGIVNACGLLRSKTNDRLYVTAGKRPGNSLENMFHVVDIRSQSVIFSDFAMGIDPHAIAETNNGKEIWIGNRDSGTIEVRDGRSGAYEVIDVIDLSDPKHGLGPEVHKMDLFDFAPNSQSLYAVLRAPDALVIRIDVKTRTVVAIQKVEGDPHGLRIRAVD